MTPEGSSSERRADNPVGDITLQDAISLVVRGQQPFGHGISAPPFSRGDVVLDAIEEVRWLVSTAIELCGREAMRSALAEALLPALLAPRGSWP